MITNMSTLCKALVAVLLMGACFTTAQAAGTMNIGASIASKIVVDTSGGQTWTLDPQVGQYVATVANAVKVSCNKGTWTVQAAASNPKLTDGSHTLDGNFYVDASSPTSGTGYNWTSSATAGDLWKDGGKGVKSTALKFTQPVSWNDDISTTYSTVVTFTGTVN
jgi:hypothetical protein